MISLNMTGLFLLLMVFCHLMSVLCELHEPLSLRYSREFLLLLRNSGEGVVDPLTAFPADIVRSDSTSPNHGGVTKLRKRGRRGGVRQRLKRQGHRRIPLPTIMLANVQSLRNKMDELQANVKYLKEYNSACLLALTETWLKDHDSYSDLEIDGFGEPYRLDRDPTVTGKSLGGGLCLYVNKNWCNQVVVRDTLCTPDIELLSVSLRPHYLPREFPQLFVTLIYIHPKANVDMATRTIVKTVQKLQKLAPDAPNFVMGDFNHCKMGKSLCSFYQYVTCLTRNMKCLDLCYGSVKGAYKSLCRAPLGMSDHNVVYLVPSYKSVLKKTKPERCLVPEWSEESINCLQDCFSCTDWDVFTNDCADLDELTETVSAYITFCEDLVIPKKEICIYPNNKPWVTKSVKNSIIQRNICFKQGDVTQYKVLQKQVKRELKLARLNYKDKVEHMLSTGNTRPAWEGVKSMMGMNSKKSHISLNGKPDVDLSNDLNVFYNRFNIHDFSQERDVFKNAIIEQNIVNVDKDMVLKLFRGVRERTSPGPDGIGGRIIKNCAVQLADIFCFIFNKSLCLHKVPRIWKESIIVPVPKNNVPKSLNEFRPIALTSLIMKSFERIVKDALMTMVQANLDPFQFAYRPGRGVDDAISTLLNMIFSHLEGTKTFVRLVFIDFSSAFNCIQPHILAESLKSVHNIDPGLICWLMDFLMERSQRVKVNGILSDALLSSTGSPQGCVLSPLLFVLYTNECQTQLERRRIIKFADDSVIVSLLNNEDPDHGPVLADFTDWCNLSFLDINALKTKEMIVDFRKNPTVITPIAINGNAIEVVHQFKYLGTVIDDKLTFEAQVDTVCRKAHQRLYFLRKLGGFNVDNSFMKMFYSCFIESVITFSFVCWYGSLNLKNRNRLRGIVKVCGKIVGASLNDLNNVYITRTLRKAELITMDLSHPLQKAFKLLPSSRRYYVPLCRTNRFKNSFVPAAIGFLNNFR